MYITVATTKRSSSIRMIVKDHEDSVLGWEGGGGNELLRHSISTSNIACML